MCRKTLEAICAANGVHERNLLNSLKKLREQGVIEQRLYEWADTLRIAGNEAAHDVDVRVSAPDAKDVLEFTKALLEYTFTFRDKFEKFRERRTKRNPGDAR
jgi:DNA-binding Lrp family transcriptional regulator